MVPERPRFYAAVAVQFAVLVFMIVKSFSILASGREIRLKVVPVDPRSLISGDYVILSYEPSTVTATPPGDAARYQAGDRVFVRLVEGPGGLWQAGEATATAPGGELHLAGKVKTAWADGPGSQRLRVEYGIESWYVPEGTGGEVERRAREGSLVAVVAVTGDGRCALKRLEP